jgi:beta-glucosidase
LKPGRGAEVTLRLTARDLSSWNSARNRWRTHSGRYRIMIGSSSRDVRATARLEVRAGG